MATVAQMIEWMKTLPQDAEVECGQEVRGSYESYMEMVAVDIESCNVMDFTSEKARADYPFFAGRVIIELRGE
jgi:hypothetical protein